MTLVDIEKLDTENKCIFCTMLIEKAYEYIADSRGKLFIKNALTHCWEWLETGRYCGDDFYNAVIEDVYLTGFLYCAIAAEKASNKSTGAWYCIEETMMYIARKAYEKDGNRDFDEAIEEVQEECIEKAIEFLSETADIQDYTDEVYNLCLSEMDLESIK